MIDEERMTREDIETLANVYCTECCNGIENCDDCSLSKFTFHLYDLIRSYNNEVEDDGKCI